MRAFQVLKEHIGKAFVASINLLLYSKISKMAVNSILVKEKGQKHLPVYYVSKALQWTKARYPRLSCSIIKIAIILLEP